VKQKGVIEPVGISYQPGEAKSVIEPVGIWYQPGEVKGVIELVVILYQPDEVKGVIEPVGILYQPGEVNVYITDNRTSQNGTAIKYSIKSILQNKSECFINQV